MILPDSILSAFTEKGTLLKWLKKVEAALKADVLTDISLNQISETQVTIKLTFADGSTVQSPVLTMPRGLPGTDGASASVTVGTTETGAADTQALVVNSGTSQNAVLNFVIPRGRDGKDGKDGQGIAATVTVGGTTTVEPGTPAGVTNIGTEQNAILDFSIPRGEKGEKGNPGADGVGFNSATQVQENAAITAISETETGMTVNGSFKITAGGEVYEIPSVFKLPIKGSSTVVVDVDETGTYFTVHLDAEIVAKLEKALVKPVQPPATVTLVAIDTNGAQTAVTIGDGLEIVNGVLQIKQESTGETWLLNETLNGGILPQENINFVSNERSFVAIRATKTTLAYYIDEMGDEVITVYTNGNWLEQSYRTVTFLEHPAGTGIVTWLQANGTKQG